MKRIFKFIAQLCALLLVTVFTVHTMFPGFDALVSNAGGISPTTIIDFLTVGTAGIGIHIASGWLVKATSDPQLFKKWSDAAIKMGENKTEFTESDIGVSWGDDGPLVSQRMPASPIKLEQNLKAGGKYIDVPIDNPLFTSTSAILNSGRFEKQQKEGAEYKLTRDNFRCPIDKWSLPVGEDAIEEGEQQTANVDTGKLMKRFVEKITDTEATRKDTGLWAGFFAGADYHHFINAAQRASLSNGAVPVKDVDGGLMFAPTEHRRTYVWYSDNLNAVVHNSTIKTFETNITEAIDNVIKTDVPTLSMLRKISRICKNGAMIPCTMKSEEGSYNDVYFVYLPGGVRDLLEDDTDFKSVMNSSYQGQMKNNPMLHGDDVVYKNLVIRDSAKLDDAYFTVKNSFNAIATANTYTTAMSFDKSTTNSVETLGITPGVRSFTAAGLAANSLGAGNTDLLKRISVIGAAGMVRAQGKQYGLKRKKEDDYESEIGINKTSQFGQLRVENWKTDGTYQSTPQSFQVLCLGENVA